VVANSSILFTSNITAEGQIVPFNTNVFLKSGRTVVFSVGPAGGRTNTGLSAVITKLPCDLQGTATYDATSSKVITKFTIQNSSAATWNAWLSYQDTMEKLFSVSQPITNQPKVVTKTIHSPKRGGVGVLSTLTTPEEGIICSCWLEINTGKVP
jgi:hypothetical protein